MKPVEQLVQRWQQMIHYFGSGQRTLMLAAYAMISTALVEFILFHRQLPPERFYAVIVLLSVLLSLNAAWERLQQRWGNAIADRVFFSTSSIIFLAANYIGLDTGWTFLPFLLFVLASQAIVGLGVWRGLGVSLLLYLGWCGVLWLRRVPLIQIVVQAPSIALGLIFVLIFSIVAARLVEQTARAERLAAELQSVNVALAAAREREVELAAAEERVRLAREIHDGLGHHLTALNVQLQAAARLLNRDPERAAQALAICREEAQAALNEVRQSVAVMRHAPVNGRPLPEVIAKLVADFKRVSPLHVQFVVEGEIGELPLTVAMALYRAVQEGLTNAQKHGQGTTVTVRLIGEVGQVRLEVVNDGPPAPPVAETGFGLAGLRERAARLGGTLYAEPLPAGGFRLAMVVPHVQTEEKPYDPHSVGR
jgi:signal transduction histidine kinase